MSDTKQQIQIENTKHGKYQKTPARQIIFKLQKIKDEEKILKEAKGNKHSTYRRERIRITFDSSETMSMRREWNEIFEVLREIKHQPRTTCTLLNDP